MRDRITTIGPIAATADAIGLCCGLPVLLSLGIAGAIASWSLQNWVLIWARARRCRVGTVGPRPATRSSDPSTETDRARGHLTRTGR